MQAVNSEGRAVERGRSPSGLRHLVYFLIGLETVDDRHVQDVRLDGVERRDQPLRSTRPLTRVLGNSVSQRS
jgi:hypothetical protein